MARQLCLRKRDMALSTQDQVKSKKLKRIIFMCAHKAKLPGADVEAASKLAHMALDRYFQINLQVKRNMGPAPAKRIRIAQFSENDCWNFFCTRKEDLYRMMRGLRFDRDFILDNG